jgi:hypothetical protein
MLSLSIELTDGKLIRLIFMCKITVFLLPGRGCNQIRYVGSAMLLCQQWGTLVSSAYRQEMGIGPYKGDGEQNAVTLQWLVLSFVLQVLQDHRIKENQRRLAFEPSAFPKMSLH